MYQNTRLDLPHGPFSWQSTADLESALLRTARTERSWPPSDRSQVHRRVIHNSQVEADVTYSDHLFFGRWLITVSNKTQLRCYDLDNDDREWALDYVVSSDNEQPGRVIKSLKGASYSGVDGQHAFLAIQKRLPDRPRFGTPDPPGVW